jgi:hypothetical protein
MEDAQRHVKPLLNRAIQAQLAPGLGLHRDSTAMLEENSSGEFHDAPGCDLYGRNLNAGFTAGFYGVIRPP